jgi:hypothetical protein
MEPGREIHERPPDLGSLYLSGCSAPHLATDDNVEHLVQGEPINKLLQPVRQMLSRGRTNRLRDGIEIGSGLIRSECSGNG